jgi:hypothetical protein
MTLYGLKEPLAGPFDTPARATYAHTALGALLELTTAERRLVLERFCRRCQRYAWPERCSCPPEWPTSDEARPRGLVVFRYKPDNGREQDSIPLRSGEILRLVAEPLLLCRPLRLIVPEHFAAMVSIGFVQAARCEIAHASLGRRLSGELFSSALCKSCRTGQPRVELPWPILQPGLPVYLEIESVVGHDQDVGGIAIETDESEQIRAESHALHASWYRPPFEPARDEHGRVLSVCRTCGLEGLADGPLEPAGPIERARRALDNVRSALAALPPEQRARVLDGTFLDKPLG